MRTMIITAAILVPTAASAGGYLIPSVSPRDLGLTQAAVADQQGAGALSLNTAALAGPEGLDIAAAASVLSNRTDWSDPSLGSASLTQGPTTPPALAISYGRKLDKGQAFGIGVGFGVPAGGSLTWPSGWPGSQVIQSVKQQVFAIGVGAAFQLLPTVKFGASYARLQANEELHQSLNYLDHFGDAGLGMAGGGNTFGLAAEVKVPTVPLKLGVTYSHSAELDLTGHVHFTSVPPQLQVMIHDQAISQTLLIPDVIVVGGAYEVMPNVKVMASYEFEHWSSYKSDVVTGADVVTDANGMPSHFSVTVPRNYNNAHVIRLAGEWAQLPFLPPAAARVGVQRSLSDQPSDTLSPSLTDASSWGISIGAGYAILPSLRVDVGYEHVFFDKVSATGIEAFPGSYSTQVDLVAVGVNWHSDLGMHH